jgi:hypothetical protein
LLEACTSIVCPFRLVMFPNRSYPYASHGDAIQRVNTDAMAGPDLSSYTPDEARSEMVRIPTAVGNAVGNEGCDEGSNVVANAWGRAEAVLPAMEFW